DRAAFTFEHVGQMVVGVPWCGDHSHTHTRGHVEYVSVMQRCAFERHVVGGGDTIARTGEPREFQAAGNVVVVHVRLQHQRDPCAQPSGGRDHSVHITLRVDHHRTLAVGGYVAA